MLEPIEARFSSYQFDNASGYKVRCRNEKPASDRVLRVLQHCEPDTFKRNVLVPDTSTLSVEVHAWAVDEEDCVSSPQPGPSKKGKGNEWKLKTSFKDEELNHVSFIDIKKGGVWFPDHSSSLSNACNFCGYMKKQSMREDQTEVDVVSESSVVTISRETVVVVA